MEQHSQSAKDATNPSEKGRYLGLASEMRCLIAELQHPEANTGPGKPLETPLRTQTPQKESEAPPRSAVDDDDTIPGLEVLPPEKIWQDHVISHVKSPAYKGKKLSALSVEELEVIYKSIQKKALSDPGCSPMLREELEKITEALESLK